MKDRQVLTPKNHSLVLGRFVFGGIVGASLTVLIHLLSASAGPGENSSSMLLMAVEFANLSPAWAIYKLFGWHWKPGSFSEITFLMFLAMIIVNSLLFAALGGLIGYIIGQKLKKM